MRRRTPTSAERLLALAIAGCAWLAPAAALGSGPPEQPACIRFVGDVTLARGVAAEIHSRRGFPWSDFPLDVGLVGNLEGALAGSGDGRCEKDPRLCLGMSAGDLPLLSRAGFLAVSLENNHSRDFGDPARSELEQKLRELQVAPVTADASPAFVEVGPPGARARWGLVALDLTPPDAAGRQLAVERARLQVGRAAADADHVAVLLHAGLEGSPTATIGQRELAGLLQAWGADVVIGSHPHRVQETACTSRGFAASSLGNHLFDGLDPDSWEGAAVTCCTASGQTACTTSATERSRGSTFPRWTGHELAASCKLPARAPELGWRAHRARDRFVFVQRMKSAGDGAFFALHRQLSSFDGEDALRPYVFRVAGGRTVDLWRGTALAFPLIAARLVEVGGRELLCTLHRGDSFLVRRPETLERRWVAYRWTGFGFEGVPGAEALKVCEQL